MSRRAVSLIIITALVIVSMFVPSVSGTTTNEEEMFTANAWKEVKVSGNGPDKVVQLHFEGEISSAKDQFGNSTYSLWKSELEQAKADDHVKAIVIAVDSPGGEVIPSAELHDLIQSVQSSGKKVVISMQNMAASGGYYLSAPADVIFAMPATLTGSLGVIFSVPNYAKAADWIGYKENVIKSGEFKDIGSPLREMTDSERAIFQTLVNECYQAFVDVISKGRGIKREEVLKIADGRVYSGLQAQKIGLIDQIGTFDDATEYAVNEFANGTSSVVEYVQNVSLVEQFLSGIGVKVTPLQTWISAVSSSMDTRPRMLYLFRP